MVMKRPTPHSPAVATLTTLLCFIAVAPLVHAQTKPAPAKAAAADPVSTLLDGAEGDFFAGRYPAAILKYDEALKKYGVNMNDDQRGALTFRKAAATFYQKKWPEAEAALKDFLEKFPNGTGDILMPGNNMRGAAQLSLVEAQVTQKKYDEALAGLNAFSINLNNRFEDKVKAQTYMALVVQLKYATGTPEEKKGAVKTAINILKPITQNSLSIPEVREAAYKLVELYTKAGLDAEAVSLRKDLEAKITNPTDLVRSNFLKLDLGDSYFKQAEELQGLDNPEDVIKRNALYKQAIEAYQGVHRRKYIESFMDKAVEQSEAAAAYAKEHMKLEKDGAVPESVKKAEEDAAAIKKIRDDFQNNKAYDSLLAYRLGLCLTELKRPWEARVAFKEILDKNPEFEKADIANYYYIVALNDTRRFKEAQDECKKFLDKYPKSPVLGNVAIMLGDISMKQEEYRQAIDNFRWARQKIPGLAPRDAEYIDASIVDAYFRNVDWNDARLAIDNYLKNYPSGQQIESMVYMRALTFFYQGEYKNTRDGFDQYVAKYPKGSYIADVKYRYALVSFGIKRETDKETIDAAIDVVNRCDKWIEEFKDSDQPNVINQLPEVLNLKADAYFKISEIRSISPEDKKKYANLAVDGYIDTAKRAGDNKQVLEFALRELNKTLPSRGEWSRLRDIYDALYKRAPKSPEALGYLYWKIKCTEKLGKTPEERLQRSEEAKIILSDAIVENIDDVRQDNVESLVIELSNKLAREVKRREKMNKDKPGSAEPFDAPAELEKLLKLKEHSESLIAQARGAFARSEIAKALRNTEESDKQLNSIANNFKPDELSPTILGILGDYLVAKGQPAKALPFYTQLKENFRGSMFADYGFAGVASILLEQGKAKQALEVIADATENGIGLSKEKDLRFIEARALLETGKYDESKKAFLEIYATKEWRGEATAGSKYYLGLIEEKKGNFKEAVNQYQGCSRQWKKYEKYAVKSVYRAALLFADKLGQVQAAKDELNQNLFKNDNARVVERFKTTPEWAECEKLLERIK